VLISVKTVNKDHLRWNSDPKHMALRFFSRLEHTCNISVQKVQNGGFPLKPVNNDHLQRNSELL